MLSLTNKRILLGITGGIAAYKCAELTRLLVKAGAEVRVGMTRAATEFITPLTMQALSGQRVHLDLLDSDAEAAMGHIELARWADLVLIAPATANTISKLAQGTTDDLASTVVLASNKEIWFKSRNKFISLSLCSLFFENSVNFFVSLTIYFLLNLQNYKYDLFVYL